MATIQVLSRELLDTVGENLKHTLATFAPLWFNLIQAAIDRALTAVPG
jgi:hypothetical protein